MDYLLKLRDQSIQKVQDPWHIILLIFNILISGTGTILNSLMGSSFNSTQLICGILQFFLSFLVIPWIWSIWWGIEIYRKSTDSSKPLLG